MDTETSTTAAGAAAPAPFSPDAFRRAAEERDAAALLAMYTEDAEVVIVDHEAQPSCPRVLHGRGEVATYLADLCGRDMTHKIDRFVFSGGGAAYLESCAYPDGTKVRCAAVLDLRDGRIARQSGVQAWDSAD
jgi:hypothetical protein